MKLCRYRARQSSDECEVVAFPALERYAFDRTKGCRVDFTVPAKE
jgi:hypothetical protein